MSDSPSLRTPAVYASVLAVTLIAVALGLWGPALGGATAVAILFVAVTVTGIPHGAIDHLVAARVYDLRPTWRDQATFYGAYLALMAAYGALWPVFPAGCLIFFLGMTMYHFGQADLAYWEVAPGPARLLYVSRGLFLIGLPIAAFPEIVDPIFEAIGSVHLLEWSAVTTYQTATLAGLVGQHGIALIAAAIAAQVAPWKVGREGVNVAVLTALFVWVHPLVAFSVYFALWHSLGHILELIRFFRAEGESMSLTDFYREAALFTVLSFVLLGFLYAGLQAFGDRQEMIALLFILIAVMTLPHMVIVERMYRQREQQLHSPMSSPSHEST
ncbi:MAG: Brp/Blh family beta-carotene 15,15'-dioxygenase [Salinivenus sp.]